MKDNTHFQFKEFTNKTFAYSAQNERLEVCLGLEHVPVGPLTPQQVRNELEQSVCDVLEPSAICSVGMKGLGYGRSIREKCITVKMVSM